jgi:hypothetical protein
MKIFKISSSINPEISEISSNSITSAIKQYYSEILDLEYDPRNTDEILNDSNTKLLICDNYSLDFEIFTTIHNLDPNQIHE